MPKRSLTVELLCFGRDGRSVSSGSAVGKAEQKRTARFSAGVYYESNE